MSGTSTPWVAHSLAVLAASAFFALLLTPYVRRFATSRGWLDHPDGQRKLHTRPVPRIGGLAVYVAFVLASAAFLPFVQATGVGLDARAAHAHLVLAAGVVMLIGLADDLVRVRPWAKVLVQVLAALYLYEHGYQIRLVSNPFGEAVSLGLFALPVTLLWFVGMSNAFNLIDGLDGLATGVGLFATSTFFVAALLNERWEIALLSAALAGALLGFLRYNFNPASIFLGDCGSLFVGFVLAAMAVRGSMKSSTAIAVVAPLMGLALPILDAGIAMLRRLLGGKKLFEADGDHIHHRLLRMGFTPRRVVVTLYGVAALFGTLSLLSMSGRSQVVGTVVIAFSLITWIGVQQLGYHEFGEVRRILQRGLSFERRNIANNVLLVSLTERFRKAATAEDLWAVLVEAVLHLGFEGIELSPDPSVQAALGRPGPPREGEAGAWKVEARSPAWAWVIPLASEGRSLGKVVLAYPLSDPQVHFEPSYLLRALDEGLAVRLRMLEQEAASASAATPAPAPGDNVPYKLQREARNARA